MSNNRELLQNVLDYIEANLKADMNATELSAMVFPHMQDSSKHLSTNLTARLPIFAKPQNKQTLSNQSFHGGTNYGNP